MMKLSQLVLLREQLTTAYSTDPIRNAVADLATKIKYSADTLEDLELQAGLVELSDHVSEINTRLYASDIAFTDIINSINQKILAASARFYGDNYELELVYNSADSTRKSRVMHSSDQVNEEVLNRIRLLTDWKYPALEIGCRDGEWTQHLVAADPLYIVDYYQEFTESAVKNFTQDYQRRMRVYLSKNHDLSMLPKNQFNFVFSWNHLNYVSLDTVKQYLKSVWDLLRSGGTFMFSYNNGDTAAGAGYAENYFMSYIPKSMLVPMCESLGYTVTHSRDVMDQQQISWIEIQRPGTLSTVKAHQVMGEIKKISY